MKHFLFLLPCEIECSTKEWFPSNGNFSLVGTQHAVHFDWVLLREYGESSCLDVLNLKVKLYFWPFRTMVDITQVRDNAKARVKIEIMQFFRLLFSMVMTGWPGEIRRIYIYIYIYITSGNNFLCKPKYLDWPHDLFCLVQKCTRTGV